MQLYRGTGAGFQRDAQEGKLVDRLRQAFEFRMLYPPNEAEIRSWQNSLPEAANQILEAGLGQAEVVLEYTLPLSSKRADLLLIGTHPKTGQVSVIVWENKQWSSGEIEDLDDRVVRVLGRYLLHPQEQVARYAQYLSDFNQLAHTGNMALSGLVFLHNATSPDIDGLRSAELADVAKYRMFGMEDTGALRSFIASAISEKDAGMAADAFLTARTMPSKQLLSHVRDQIQGHSAFTLLDEQQVAYQLVRDAVIQAKRSDKKRVVIVKGGPGSGKSVIAAQVVGHLAARGYNVSHATGSKSFTTTLRKRVGGRAGNLFRYFNNFGDAEPNGLDALVSDEAHRIRETSANRFTPKAKRSNLAQVDELLTAARVPVFLLDENQVVRPNETGTVETIVHAAEKQGSDVILVDLNGQFRCGGSEAFDHWTRRFLGLSTGEPLAWEGDDRFDLQVVSTPQRLEDLLRAKQEQGFTARMTAGFCWRWSDPEGDHLVDDVVIGDWRRPWNLRPDKGKVPNVPVASLWASDPGGFGQIGCIYTAQGFEYDYNGVIMGKDLVWRSGGWVANPEESYDSAVKKAGNFDGLIRHTYRVLLTRGMNGCSIYSIDEETQHHLLELGVPLT